LGIGAVAVERIVIVPVFLVPILPVVSLREVRFSLFFINDQVARFAAGSAQKAVALRGKESGPNMLARLQVVPAVGAATGALDDLAFTGQIHPVELAALNRCLNHPGIAVEELDGAALKIVAATALDVSGNSMTKLSR